VRRTHSVNYKQLVYTVHVKAVSLPDIYILPRQMIWSVLYSYPKVLRFAASH